MISFFGALPPATRSHPMMTPTPKVDRAALVADVHLRLLAEAASDALERQAAYAEIAARAADLVRVNDGLLWTKRRWS